MWGEPVCVAVDGLAIRVFVGIVRARCAHGGNKIRNSKHRKVGEREKGRKGGREEGRKGGREEGKTEDAMACCW